MKGVHGSTALPHISHVDRCIFATVTQGNTLGYRLHDFAKAAFTPSVH